MTAYYNEIDPYAAQWLRNLIAVNLVAPGDVDERSIVDVQPDDLKSYGQCHFFAGIGGWSRALRLAGWPDDRPVWTGSCPCQPFSAAGAGKAADDRRHLWPAWLPLIAERRPPIVFGEQVEAAIGHGWLDAVFADLEGQGYACGAAVLPACGVGAPHIRQRLWFVADAGGERRQQIARSTSGDEAADGRARRNGEQANGDHVASGDGENSLADAMFAGRAERRPVSGHRPPSGSGGTSGVVNSASEQVGLPGRARQSGSAVEHADGGGCDGRPCGPQESRRDLREPIARAPDHWREVGWLDCRDGKRRPVEPGTFPMAHGVPARVGKLRAYGNAIVPAVASEFIQAYLEIVP
jgi:DNA (cytosine-5)-methyltransferase 1